MSGGFGGSRRMLVPLRAARPQSCRLLVKNTPSPRNTQTIHQGFRSALGKPKHEDRVVTRGLAGSPRRGPVSVCRVCPCAIAAFPCILCPMMGISSITSVVQWRPHTHTHTHKHTHKLCQASELNLGGTPDARRCVPAAGQRNESTPGHCCSQQRVHAGGGRPEELECVDTIFGCVAVGWRGCAAVFPFGHALRVRTPKP